MPRVKTSPTYAQPERRVQASADALLTELGEALSGSLAIDVDRLVVLVEVDHGRQQPLRTVRVVDNLLILSGDTARPSRLPVAD